MVIPSSGEILKHGQILPYNIYKMDHANLRKSNTCRTRICYINYIKLNILLYKGIYYGYAITTTYGPHNLMLPQHTPDTIYKSHLYKWANTDLTTPIFKRLCSDQDMKLFRVPQVKTIIKEGSFNKYNSLTKYINARGRILT